MDYQDIVEDQGQRWGEKAKDLHELGVRLGLEDEETEDDFDENYPNGGTVEAYDIEVEKELCEE